MTIKRIIILMLLILSLYACNIKPEDNLSNQADNTTVKQPSDYELKLKKLNVLIDSFNGFTTSAFEAYQEYISSFGSDANFYKAKEVDKFSEIQPSDIHKLESLEDILEIPVLEELNSLIIAYKINARAFSVAINSCERYYTSKGYKKDNFENGKGMHKPVIEIYARFSVVDSLLKVRCNKISKKLELEYLDKLKKGGFEVEYLSIIGKNEAEKLNTLLMVTTYNDLTVEQLVLSHNKIKNIYDKLNSLKSDDTNEFNDNNMGYLKNFKQFYQAFDELYLHKKEKKKFSKKELKELKQNEVTRYVEGSVEKVIYKYKELLKSKHKT